MFALLLPLILGVAPKVAGWLLGSQAQEVAGDVSGVLQKITGTSDERTAVDALKADPEKMAAFQAQMAKIQADREAAQEASRLEEYKTMLSDVANARAQTVQLAQTGSSMAWGAPVVSAVTMIAFGIVTYLLMTRQIQTNEAVMLIVGALIAMAQSVVSYWVGSSSGSAAKSNQLERVIGQIRK